MPTIPSAPRLGSVLFAGLLGLGASAAMAAADPEFVVSEHAADARTVPVHVNDLDLAAAYDRHTLAVRIDKAARHVCDVTDGSKLDTLPSATACLDQARSGAVAQLEARGLDGRQLAMLDFSALR